MGELGTRSCAVEVASIKDFSVKDFSAKDSIEDSSAKDTSAKDSIEDSDEETVYVVSEISQLSSDDEFACATSETRQWSNEIRTEANHAMAEVCRYSDTESASEIEEDSEIDSRNPDDLDESDDSCDLDESDDSCDLDESNNSCDLDESDDSCDLDESDNESEERIVSYHRFKTLCRLARSPQSLLFRPIAEGSDEEKDEDVANCIRREALCAFRLATQFAKQVFVRLLLKGLVVSMLDASCPPVPSKDFLVLAEDVKREVNQMLRQHKYACHDFCIIADRRNKIVVTFKVLDMSSCESKGLPQICMLSVKREEGACRVALKHYEW
jgi:hypothetical protein